jgi:hypothetical protein
MSRIKSKTLAQVEQSIFSEDKPDARKEPKEFEIVREPIGLYRIRYTAGGEIPDSMKGLFTSIPRAQAVIDNIVAERKQKTAG